MSLKNEQLEKEILLAKEALLNHGVIALPTETVMGLGVIYNDEQAYHKLNQVKERPEDKPYTMMLGDKKDISKYALINEATQRVINKFIPGSITILVPTKEDSVPSYVTHNTHVIGIRVPTNMEALNVLHAIDMPLLVPSANKSGKKPALNSDEVKEIFENEIDAIVSGSSKGEKPSTIVNLTGEEPMLIREGPIAFEEILKVWANKNY